MHKDVYSCACAGGRRVG